MSCLLNAFNADIQDRVAHVGEAAPGSFPFSKLREAVVAASPSYADSINLVVDIVVNLARVALRTKVETQGGFKRQKSCNPGGSTVGVMQRAARVRAAKFWGTHFLAVPPSSSLIFASFDPASNDAYRDAEYRCLPDSSQMHLLQLEKIFVQGLTLLRLPRMKG
jgi:hypothetical protein